MLKKIWTFRGSNKKDIDHVNGLLRKLGTMKSDLWPMLSKMLFKMGGQSNVNANKVNDLFHLTVFVY